MEIQSRKQLSVLSPNLNCLKKCVAQQIYLTQMQENLILKKCKFFCPDCLDFVNQSEKLIFFRKISIIEVEL